jgi:membrane associated rhomboid family serine protease
VRQPRFAARRNALQAKFAQPSQLRQEGNESLDRRIAHTRAMFPLGDDLVRLRPSTATIALLLLIAAAWLLLQGGGFDERTLAATVCNLGLVPGELTGMAPLGQAVPLSDGLACVVDDEAINWLTPLTSMFLHGGWAHVLGNALFLWAFGRSVEERAGHGRFVVFYLLCGVFAAAAQTLLDPASPVPVVGASGAISGVMGAYLALFPTARIRMLFIFIIFFKVFRIPAWIVLLYWFGVQLLMALPELSGAQQAVSSGVAVMAHVGGFIAGALLARPMLLRGARGVPLGAHCVRTFHFGAHAVRTLREGTVGAHGSPRRSSHGCRTLLQLPGLTPRGA